MAVKLNVHANVTGQQQLAKLSTGLKSLGTQALIAKRKLASLEAAAARSKATMASLGTALKVGAVAGFAAAGFAAASFVKSTFRAGNIMESAQIQFKAFFGSAEDGAKAFKLLNEYASTVPFSIDEIIQGSTALAAISDGPEDLGKQLEIVGNLAAAANLSFSDAALQYQKVASAGIAAADLLRDRGVKALLGFTEGVRYTAEESIAVFEKNYSKNGRFGKVADELAGTLKGSASMVQDFYFQLNAAAAKPLFEGLTKQINELVGDFKKNDAQLKAMGVRIGESLAVGFKKLGDFIRLVVDNFDKLVIAIKIFLALKVVNFIGGIAAQLLLLASGAKGATGAMAGLNMIIRANPLGVLITVIQGAVIAWIVFGDKIKEIGSYISSKLTPALTKLRDKFSEFADADETNLDVFDEDVKSINKLREALVLTSEEFKKASEARFSYLRGTGNRWDDNAKMLKRKNYQQPHNPQEGFTLSKEKPKDKSEDTNQLGINSDAHIQLHALKLKQIKEYRAQLSLVGIDSQKIGGIIGDTWLEGIKQGNSLLETTKNAFKNVLISISDTIVKRTAEILVEKIFNSLIDQRIMKQRTLNAATSQQGTIMSGLISKAGSLFSAMGSGGGMGSKLGGLFSMGRSFFKFAEGGVVPGGAPYTDRVPAMLTPGEVVVPRDKVGQQSGNTSITNINISGNVDQRSIDQIKGVISSASAEVGGANKAYTKNTQGVRGRNI